MGSSRTLGLTAIALLAACSFPELDHRGKTGPCTPGWIGEPGEVCRLPSDGGADAARDASTDRAATDLGIGDAALDTVLDSAIDVLSDGETDAGGATDAGIEPCRPGMILCDDFEGDLSVWEYVPAATHTAPAFLEGTSRSGSRALRVPVQPPILENTGSHFQFTFGSPLRATTLHVRYYIYLEAGDYFHVNHVGLAAAETPFGYFDVKSRSNSFSVFVGEETMYFPGTRPIPQEEWVCASMRVEISDTGSFEVKVGTDVVSRELIDTEPPGGIIRLRLGAFWAEPRHGETVYWIDDVAVDEEPLLCP